MLRAVLGAVAICCSMWAVTLLDLGVNMVMTALTPVWVALLSPLALREQPSRRDPAAASASCHVAMRPLPDVKPRLSDDLAAQVVLERDLCLQCRGRLCSKASLSWPCLPSGRRHQPRAFPSASRARSPSH